MFDRIFLYKSSYLFWFLWHRYSVLCQYIKNSSPNVHLLNIYLTANTQYDSLSLSLSLSLIFLSFHFYTFHFIIITFLLLLLIPFLLFPVFSPSSLQYRIILPFFTSPPLSLFFLHLLNKNSITSLPLLPHTFQKSDWECILHY